ncbi:MAG: hypothetical protein AB7I13_14480 [Vicinamibacterales bacterium]
MTFRPRAVWIAAAAFLAAHLPFLPRTLEDLDSINFALGLRAFDVAQHQPHPPGYPIFIALGRLARLLVPGEATALAAMSVCAGTLGVIALAALFRALAERELGDAPWMALALTVAAPLYWVTAARPLSDMSGLAAVVLAQLLCLRARTPVAFGLAACVAALAVGIRSQVVWLTAPLLLLALWRLGPAERLKAAMAGSVGYAAGALAWGVPLLALSGGLGGYLRALGTQGAEDFAGVAMLATQPSARLLVDALHFTFIAPWGAWWIAVPVLACACVGLFRVGRRGPVLASLAAAFGPYAVFHLVFQETATTRYALPLVPPIAFLAAAGLSWLPRVTGATAAAAIAGAGVLVGGTTLRAYASSPPPAFRVLADMRTLAATQPAPPALAMHRRQELDMRRPLLWERDRLPAWSAHLPAPPKHEWLELVKYWNAGGRAPIWFLADPPRSDLALVDPRSVVRRGEYRWGFERTDLIGGARPNVMDWYEITRPNWYLGEGWALTPETAGVAADERRGPGRSPIQAWVRRRGEAATLMIGGRYFGAGADVPLTVSVEGRVLLQGNVRPGFFLRFADLPPGALDGDAEMVPLTVTAGSADVAIEQFDVQSAGEVVYGFGDGWQEREYDPRTGRLWRWTSERADLRVVGPPRELVLRLEGEFETGAATAHVTVRAGDRLVAERDVPAPFVWDVPVPAGVLGSGGVGTLTIETSEWYVPAEMNWRPTGDRRRLGLRVVTCELRPAS